MSLALLLSWSTRVCHAEDALKSELGSLASDFASLIQKLGGGSVAVGEFSASSDVKGGVGPRLQKDLAQELEQFGVKIDNDKFRFEIKGDYQPLVDKSTNLLGVKLIARLIDRETGDPIVEQPTGRFIFGAETVPAMLGLNLSGPPVRDPKELSDRFKEAKDHPQVKIEGTKVQGNTGKFAIEIIVKEGNHYSARRVTTDDSKRPFVSLENSEIYGVRLINNASFEAAVDLCLDGVNCFAFSDKPLQYWILKPGQSLDVLGWHRNDTTTTEFKVVSNFPESAAAKLNLKPSASIGLITASFSAAWTIGGMSPPDEPRTLADQGGQDKSATGFGSDINFHSEQVQRTIGQVRDLISVRYER